MDVLAAQIEQLQASCDPTREPTVARLARTAQTYLLLGEPAIARRYLTDAIAERESEPVG